MLGFTEKRISTIIRMVKVHVEELELSLIMLTVVVVLVHISHNTVEAIHTWHITCKFDLIIRILAGGNCWCSAGEVLITKRTRDVTSPGSRRLLRPSCSS